MAGNEGQAGSLVDPDTGVLCRDRVLVQRTQGAVLFLGIGSRAAQLRRFAFSEETSADPFIAHCRRIAAAVENGKVDKAWSSGISRSLVETDDRGLRRLAVAEALAKAGYDPDEPRVPAGNGRESGEWTAANGGDTQAQAKLAPGERIDDLGDLLEWIANAESDDERAIRGEIKRLYYDVGDVQGGNALNAALSNALEPGLTPQDRQNTLDRIAIYARSDPAEVAQFGRDLVTGSLLRPRTAPIATTEHIWKLGWGARGRRINTALGANLPDNFPVVDRFADGVVTSIKSVDLNAAAYRDATRLSARINAYVDQVAAFDGAEGPGRVIDSSMIKGRALNLAIPKGSMTFAQRAAIATARRRAKSLGVDLIATPF